MRSPPRTTWLVPGSTGSVAAHEAGLLVEDARTEPIARYALLALAFAASIPLALLSTGAAQLLWLVSLLLPAGGRARRAGHNGS